jgi:hypothetical protein
MGHLNAQNIKCDHKKLFDDRLCKHYATSTNDKDSQNKVVTTVSYVIDDDRAS